LLPKDMYLPKPFGDNSHLGKQNTGYCIFGLFQRHNNTSHFITTTEHINKPLTQRSTVATFSAAK